MCGDAAGLKFGEVRAHTDRALVCELAPQAISGLVGEYGIDVTHRVPAWLLKLDGTGDRVAEEQDTFFAELDGDAQMSGSVPGRQENLDAARDGRVQVHPAQSRRADPAAEPGLDVAGHLTWPVDEVVPVCGAEPDRRLGEDRVSVLVEQPADVVGVKVGADDVGDLVTGDADGA